MLLDIVFDMKHYTILNKPNFSYGTMIQVDMGMMGCPNLGILQGKIVGKGSENFIDMWLVEFDYKFSPDYQYKVTSIIHTAIFDESI
jgi:hypothetical protein